MRAVRDPAQPRHAVPRPQSRTRRTRRLSPTRLVPVHDPACRLPLLLTRRRRYGFAPWGFAPASLGPALNLPLHTAGEC
jgi:hypothetical protein